MRKNKLFFSASIALTAVLLSGCADKLATDGYGQQTADRDQVRYMNVTISNPTGAGTRADDGNFIFGTGTENFVKSMLFVFYDASGQPTGQAFDKTFGTNDTDDGFSTGSGSVEKIWTSTVEVSLAQGENLPAYVVAFINSQYSTDLKSTSMKDIYGITRQSVVYTTEGKDLFPMTNSVYYGTNPVTGEINVRVFASPVSSGQLYTTKEDAGKPGAKTVDIYVERYASRVTLNMAPGAVKDNIAAVDGYTLRFVPEAWRVNATDKDIYAVKRFGLLKEEDGTVNYDPSYAELNKNFNGKDWWNESGRFRSYWACTPSYYTNKYPKVSDNITDNRENNDHTEGETDAYPYDVHYFNYSQFKTGTVPGATFLPAIVWDATNGFNKPFYARETTTASTAWKRGGENYNPLATIPSAVIVGHYDLTRTDDTKPAVGENKTFYLFGKTSEGKHNLYFEDKIVGEMVKLQNVVLTRGADGNGNSYSAYREAAGFKVAHPSKNVRDVKKTSVAGRLVALQLDGTNLDGLYYYNGNTYEEITEDNLNNVNSELLGVGYATKYGDGIAYFNIPVEHLGIYSSIGTDNAGTYVVDAKNDDGSYNFDKCPAGSFGIVRNHSYTINVGSISGLGTALSDKNQPIVPPVGESSYYVSAKVNILSWRVVPAQNVNL